MDKESLTKIQWPHVLFGVLLSISCENPKQDFLRGRTAVTEARYDDGLEILENFITQNSKTKYSSRAQLFIAKAWMGKGDYQKAITEFKDLIQKYPDSLEAHKALYKLALLNLAEGRSEEALEQFQTVVKQANGPLVPEATLMVGYLKK